MPSYQQVERTPVACLYPHEQVLLVLTVELISQGNRQSVFHGQAVLLMDESCGMTFS